MRGKVDDVTLNMQLATWIVNHPFQDNEASIGGEKRRDWVRRMFKDNQIFGKSIDAMASKEAFLRRKYHNAKHWAANAGQQFLSDHGVEAFNDAVLKRCPWFYIFEAGSEKDEFQEDYPTLTNNIISFGGDMRDHAPTGRVMPVENMDSSAGIKNEVENHLDATSKNIHIFPTNFKVGNSDTIDVDGSSNFMASGESSEHGEKVSDELEFDEVNDDTSNLICDSLESGRYTFKDVLPKTNTLKQGENRNEELSRTPLSKKHQRCKLNEGNAIAELKFLQLQLEREKFELEKQGKVLERERWEWEKETKVSERERWEWEKVDKVNERRHEKEMAELRIKELELKWKLSVGN